MKQVLISLFLLCSGTVWAQSPDSPTITHLSLDSLTQQVHIYWNNTSVQTVGYIVYFQDPTGLWVPLDTVLGVLNTSYVTQNSNALYSSETYSVVAFDALGNNSARSEEHSTVFLQHIYNECDSLCVLMWNRYENMFLGDSYRLRVYSGPGGNSLSLVEEIALPFADTSISYLVDYSLKYYFILSVHSIEDSLANSNHTEMATTVLEQPEYCYINKVSVNDANEIAVHALTNSLGVDYFNIYRSSFEDGFMQEIGQATAVGLEGVFVDKLVVPERNIYYYSAKPVDLCGKEYTLPVYYGISDTAKVHNLKLQPLSITSERISVAWNEYEGFLETAQHELWLEVNDSLFSVLEISDDSTAIVDVSDYVGSICLYVQAIEGVPNVLGRKDTVFSNKACLNKEPIVTIPTAFSPDNGDMKNDIWKAAYYEESAVYSVSVSVYSLWGQKVFESTEIAFSWDGTINQSKAPSGSYVYHLTFTYGNGVVAEQKGVLTILR